MSRTTVFACAHVPSTTTSVTGPAGGSRRMSRALGPGYSSTGGRSGSRERRASGALSVQSTPTCSSACGKHRLAMRAVPIGMSRSRRCCRITIARRRLEPREQRAVAHRRCLAASQAATARLVRSFIRYHVSRRVPPARRPATTPPCRLTRMTTEIHARELRSRITAAGELELALADITLPEPTGDQVVVRIEAAPINPSDLALLFGAADLATARRDGARLIANVPAPGLRAMHARLDQALPVGNEGAGTVIAAGASAQGLVGKRVALASGGMFARPQDRARRRMHGATGWVDRGAGRVGGGQPDDRARDGRGDATRRPQRARPHGRGVEPRPDARPGSAALTACRSSTSSAASSRSHCCAASVPSTCSTARVRVSARRSSRRSPRPVQRSRSTRSAAVRWPRRSCRAWRSSRLAS